MIQFVVAAGLYKVIQSPLEMDARKSVWAKLSLVVVISQQKKEHNSQDKTDFTVQKQHANAQCDLTHKMRIRLVSAKQQSRFRL